MTGALSVLALAAAPIFLTVQGVGDESLRTLEAALQRAMLVDGREVFASAVAAPPGALRVCVTALPDGTFAIEARYGSRVERLSETVNSPHAFEQARTLALDVLALAEDVARPVRAEPPPCARPVAHPAREVEVAPARKPSPMIEAGATMNSAQAATTPPTNPVVQTPVPAMSPAAAPLMAPPPAAAAGPSASSLPPPGSRARRSFFDSPEHPHLDVMAGGALVAFASGSAAWRGSFFGAVRAKAGPVELTLQAEVPPRTGLSWQYPLAILTSVAVPGASAVRVGGGFEGVVLGDAGTTAVEPQSPPHPTNSATFSPGGIVQLQYRPTSGRFALATIVEATWHPAQMSYPEWTVALAVGLDAIIW